MIRKLALELESLGSDPVSDMYKLYNTEQVIKHIYALRVSLSYVHYNLKDADLHW